MNFLKETGEIKEKDELDYKIVVVKRRHKFNVKFCLGALISSAIFLPPFLVDFYTC